jgi:acyl-CoA thioester hydrolase
VPFSTHLTVTAAEIDELSHVSNVVYLQWVLLAARRHSEAVGLSLNDYLSTKHAFVVTRHELDYLRPAVEHDEIEITTQVSAMTVATSVRHTRIIRARDQELLARAVTRWAYVDLATGRPARIPDLVHARFTVEPETETVPTRRRA